MKPILPTPLKLLPSFLIFITFFIGTTNNYSQNFIFADQVTFESNVDNAANATVVDSNFATLNSFGGLVAGVGDYTGELELEFPENIPANTTTYIRIDFDPDFLNCLTGGSLGSLLADSIGTVIFGNHYFNVEARDSSDATVFSATCEIPPFNGRFRVVQDALGNFYIAITPDQPYNKVYIEDNTDSLLLGTFHSMNVYHAFYYTDNQCSIDPLFTDYDGAGITLDLINIGGAGVTNAHYAIDQDPDNFSEISLGILGVIASIEQNVYFPAPYTPQDEFEITFKTDPTLLSLGILNNIQVSAYNGTLQVFSDNMASFITLDLLTLLQNGERASVPFDPGVSFDKVTIRLTSLLNVNIAQSIDFYGVNVSRPDAPTTTNSLQTFCAVDDPVVGDIQVNESNIIWYNASTGGTAYHITDPLTHGLTYYAAQIENGCESELRLEVTVHIDDTPAPTTSEPTQIFCVIDNPTVADLQATGPNIIWYDAPTGGTPYATTESLVNGQTYYASATNATGCESSSRLEVTAQIEDTPIPTTTDPTQIFCVIDNPTVADLQATGPNINWYDAPTGGTPYATTEPLVDGQIYYASATNATGCESSNRLEVTAQIEDTPIPTTTDPTQTFCMIDDPTVADLQATGPNIIWYDAPTGGTPYATTEPLVDGQTYYASATNATGCESSNRLEVTAQIEDTPIPTTTDPTQAFCMIDDPTVADLQATGPNIIWYDAPTGGTPYATTEPLVDGQTYYASATNATGCESSNRLEVTAQIEDTPIPTTTDPTQAFCMIDDPTVADLQATGPNIIWYDAPTGGTPYATTEPLVDGLTYYASATNATGCESSNRLEVTAQIEDTPIPTTTDPTQTFCVIDNPTVADLQATGPNIVWYDAPTGGTPYATTEPLVDGLTYYASATNATGCESSNRLEVTVQIEDVTSPTISSDAGSQVCLETIITYTTEPGHENYIWDVSGGIVIEGGSSVDNFVRVEWTTWENTMVSVSYDPVGECNSGALVTFNETVEICSDLTITKTVSDPNPMIGDEISFIISVTNEGPNGFENVIVQEHIQSGFELISFNATIGNYDPLSGIWTIDFLPPNETAVLTVLVRVLGTGDYTNTAIVSTTDPEDANVSNNIVEVGVLPICLVVYNEFSPNADGINDRFVIDCIESYPDNELQIFNRYGSLVYKQQGYQNEWDGTANISGVDNNGDILPSGTYYYILKINTDLIPKSGWIFLMK